MPDPSQFNTDRYPAILDKSGRTWVFRRVS
jgi:hypothetical protein